MPDALKGFTGGGKAQKQAEDFQALIASAKEERSALNAMLAQIALRSSRLSQVGKTLEDVAQKTSATSWKIADVDARVAGIEERIRTFTEIDVRIQALLAEASEAQQAAAKLVAPDSDLQKHRQAAQQLSSQML
ncbi:MAG: hypothetical protein EXQ53_10125 [Acidobacteria bacterium]|nr:hypothetical protein [Acidobacteriota bacterium]